MFWRKKQTIDDEPASKDGLCVVMPLIGDEEMENLIYHSLRELPVFAHTLRALNKIPVVQEVVLLARQEDLVQVADVAHFTAPDKEKHIVCAEMFDVDALLRGLYTVNEDMDYIALHNPLCPFIDHEVMRDGYQTAKKRGAARASLPVTDTVKIVRDNMVLKTPDRTMLYTLQYPIVVEGSLLKAALTKAGDGAMDYHTILDGLGLPVVMSKGKAENIRIGQPTDLVHARAMLDLMEDRIC